MKVKMPNNVAVISGAQASGKTTMIEMIKSTSAEVHKVSNFCMIGQLEAIHLLGLRKALILIDEFNVCDTKAVSTVKLYADLYPTWQFMLFTNQAISFETIEWQKAWFISPIMPSMLSVPNPGICRDCKCAHLVDNRVCKYDKFCINKQRISAKK